MSRANVAQSLGAAEQALEHFVASLDRAGFAEGAGAYRRMADVIVGQWLWAEQEGVGGLKQDFLRVSRLAGTVAERLRPYVGAMDQLQALQGMAAEASGVEPGSLGEQIVEALERADEGMTMAELRRLTEARSGALSRELDSLIARGLVRKHGRQSRRFMFAGHRR